MSLLDEGDVAKITKQVIYVLVINFMFNCKPKVEEVLHYIVSSLFLSALLETVDLLFASQETVDIVFYIVFDFSGLLQGR